MEPNVQPQQPAMEGKMAKPSKKKWIVLGIILVILLGIGIAAAVAYRTLLSAPVVTGQVEPRNLGVEVYVNGNLVSSSTPIREGDTIETKMGGNAAVKLFESSVVLLDMNTKIVIESLKENDIRIRLDAGRTWHEVSGIHTSGHYSVTDGTYTAAVKGTAFEMQHGGTVLTAEGSVEVEGNGSTVEVKSGEVVEVKDGILVKRVVTAQEKGTLAGGLQQSIAELQQLRNEEIAKYPEVLNIVKERFNTDEATIRQTLLDADIGKYDVDAELAKFPIKVPVISRVAGFTKEIQALQNTRSQFIAP